MRWWHFIFLVVLLLALPVQAAETIPPSPSPHYIVDDAHVLSATTLQTIDKQLEKEERDTANQIVVGIYPTMQSEDDIAAYAARVFQAWKIGQKGKDNGVLFLAFIQDRKMNITTGYGLEGALPDATAKQIIDNEIKPHFKANDYDGGVQAGVNAILAATHGEYKGTGFTHLDAYAFPAIIVFAIALLFFAGLLSSIYGTSYASGGITPSWVIPFIFLSNMTSSRSSGWSSGGGGGFFGGGGGFSGGGGMTGGGGASGSW